MWSFHINSFFIKLPETMMHWDLTSSPSPTWLYMCCNIELPAPPSYIHSAAVHVRSYGHVWPSRDRDPSSVARPEVSSSFLLSSVFRIRREPLRTEEVVCWVTFGIRDIGLWNKIVLNSIWTRDVTKHVRSWTTCCLRSRLSPKRIACVVVAQQRCRTHVLPRKPFCGAYFRKNLFTFATTCYQSSSSYWSVAKKKSGLLIAPTVD